MLPSSLPKLLTQQLAFILEIDKLKTILRKNHTLTAKRRENSAEHSWHLILAAMVLSEYSNEKIDLLQALKLLAIHDLVEIEAGDTFLYDRHDEEGLFLKERQAAEKTFSLLPKEQAQSFLDLWLEFEKGVTPEARFAKSLDRFLPMLLNFSSGGGTWKEFSITPSMILQKNEHIKNGSSQLWTAAQEFIKEAVQKGCFPE
ncbi:MAG: HD domain-containing protein [Chthoniobacterales bacterium]|nr:HD domain-containing protein [Chthoniobacterales bacterium]